MKQLALPVLARNVCKHGKELLSKGKYEFAMKTMDEVFLYLFP